MNLNIKKNQRQIIFFLIGIVVGVVIGNYLIPKFSNRFDNFLVGAPEDKDFALSMEMAGFGTEQPPFRVGGREFSTYNECRMYVDERIKGLCYDEYKAVEKSRQGGESAEDVERLLNEYFDCGTRKHGDRNHRCWNAAVFARRHPGQSTSER
tara:strand:- start:3826 stop:4281 length:456 start_codon:yes stop_codon:yes gene_type:complete